MNSNQDSVSGWIRPANQFEEFLEILHQQSAMITCYCVTLNTVAPLREYHVKRALLHLHRKIPTLRVCLRSKEEETWWHWMEHENLDFQILYDADFQREYDAMTVHHYNSKDGPLWCARLIPLPIETSCPITGLKETFPHQYEMVFGFHHSITDGSSTMRICSFFLDLLNDVIAGKPISDHEQLAYHATDEQTVRQISEVAANLMNNPKEMEKWKKIALNHDHEVLFTKAYPPPENTKPKTLSVPYSLNTDETSAFLKKCKTEGVSLHSGFFTVVNAAIVEMLMKAGIEKEYFELPHYHTTNNRRYWEGETSTAFGAHLGKLSTISKVSKNIINDFWNEARRYHSEFHGSLLEKGPFKEMFVMISVMNSGEDKLRTIEAMPKNISYYGTTNMGNLSSVFPGEGEHVQATNIRRTTSTLGNLCSHVLQTFRGRLLYGLDYDAASMTKATAQLYVETIFKILRKVGKS